MLPEQKGLQLKVTAVRDASTQLIIAYALIVIAGRFLISLSNVSQMYSSY